MPKKYIIAAAIFIPMIFFSNEAQSQNLFLLQDMCVKCHLLGENYGKRNSVLAWKDSAHFRADSGCVECHGGDKYMYIDFKRGHIGLPSRAEAVAICGKCHAKEKSDFLSKRAAAPTDFACTVTCVDCHGYHYVAKADAELFNKANCGGCHAFDRAAPIYKTAAKARGAMFSIETKIETYQNENFPVDSARSRLDEIGVEYVGMIHSEPMNKFERVTKDKTMKSIAELESQMEKSSPGKWKIEGAVVVTFLAIVALILLGYQAITEKS